MRLALLFFAFGLLAMAGCAITPTPQSEPQTTPQPVTLPTAGTPETPISAIFTGTVPLTGTQEVTGTATATPISGPVNTPTITTTLTVTPSVTPTDTLPITSTVTPTGTAVPTGTVIPTGTVTVTPPPTGTQPGQTPTTPTSTPQPGTPTPGQTGTPTPTQGPPTPTPFPSGVHVGNDQLFTRDGALYIMGEVINGGNMPVFSAKVIANLYDASGNRVGAQEAFTLLPATVSRQSNPFKIQMVPAPSNVQTYELDVTYDDLSMATYDRATITREEVSTTDGVTITGEMRNDQPSELRNIMVVATFYDASGMVVDAYTGVVDNPTLAPGETTTFTIQPGDPNLTYSSYLVQTQGMMIR